MGLGTCSCGTRLGDGDSEEWCFVAGVLVDDDIDVVSCAGLSVDMPEPFSVVEAVKDILELVVVVVDVGVVDVVADVVKDGSVAATVLPGLSSTGCWVVVSVARSSSGLTTSGLPLAMNWVGMLIMLFLDPAITLCRMSFSSRSPLPISTNDSLTPAETASN